jgi:hypothetical protein
MPIHIIWKLSNTLYYVGRICGNHSRLGQSHSHCTIVSFVAQQLTPGFQLTSPMRANTCGDNGLVIDGSIWFQLTSQVWANTFEGNSLMMAPYANPHHMKDVKHLIYWDGMWEPFHVGSEPQLLHNHVFCNVTHQQVHWISADVPNGNGPPHVVVMN